MKNLLAGILLLSIFSQQVIASTQTEKIADVDAQIKQLKQQPKVSCAPFSDIAKIIMIGRQSGETSSEMKESFLSYGADPKILNFIDDAYTVDLAKTKDELDNKISKFQDKLFSSCEKTNKVISQSILDLESELNDLKESIK